MDRSGCRSSDCRSAPPHRASRATPDPTVACAPMRAAGRITLCGPSVAPGSRVDPVHAHDSIMEEVGLHDASAIDRGPVAEGHEVGLGQPVAVAPDAATDLRAERAQPRGQRGGSGGRTSEPRRGHHFDERVGHLGTPHEAGPERILPRAGCGRRTTHLATVDASAAAAPAASITIAAERGAATNAPNAEVSTASTKRTPNADRAADDDRHDPAELPQRARDAQPSGRSVRAALVGLECRTPQAHRRGAEPRRARLRLRRAPPRARPRARRGRVGGRAAAMPELPRNARLPMRARSEPHPAALQFVRGDHRVVREERMVVDRGHRRDEQHGGCLHVPSHLSAERDAATRG